MNKENASKLWKIIQEAGDYLKGQLPDHPNHPKGRNPYAHVALWVKEKFNESYKFIPDENYKLLFRTSNPVDTYYYSGVLIEKNTDTTLDGSTLAGGYKVLGYSSTNPTFNFYYPIRGNQGQKISQVGNLVWIKKQIPIF